MRIIIAGSRDATANQVHKVINLCSWINEVTEVLSGIALGADSIGAGWAIEKGIPVVEYPAQWDKWGRKAGPIRNEIMACNADGLLAVWDEVSKGTKSMIKCALEHDLKMFVYSISRNMVYYEQ